TAAGSLRVQLLVVEARGASQLDGAFTAIAKERPEALLVFTDPVFYRYRQRIGDFARERHLPMISDWKETAEAAPSLPPRPSCPRGRPPRAGRKTPRPSCTGSPRPRAPPTCRSSSQPNSRWSST